mmetsp:Transcript_135322/g.263568  ORF Transcript_135322/g.263568 Transcript_135322/m.263568 type:complete len:393 (+) Transcript_135322:57-1235(+)|eukprot:CAMPEP_0172697514 /NCGR_PEP_ID=MMETSP1074-20121228/28826_1 /TAXON_ID=2916 /ORGANISM="Ceratium fusus, Strain PA161109" /LENGTH=392 /DNA_ID=CAMNT_0013518437 /DNA_START=29 /DNA_END=1207 /DNA_ORIENTATION=+
MMDACTQTSQAHPWWAEYNFAFLPVLLIPIIPWCTMQGQAEHSTNSAHTEMESSHHSTAKDDVYDIGQTATSSCSLGPTEQVDEQWRTPRNASSPRCVAPSPTATCNKFEIFSSDEHDLDDNDRFNNEIDLQRQYSNDEMVSRTRLSTQKGDKAKKVNKKKKQQRQQQQQEEKRLGGTSGVSSGNGRRTIDEASSENVENNGGSEHWAEQQELLAGAFASLLNSSNSVTSVRHDGFASVTELLHSEVRGLVDAMVPGFAAAVEISGEPTSAAFEIVRNMAKHPCVLAGNEVHFEHKDDTSGGWLRQWPSGQQCPDDLEQELVFDGGGDNEFDSQATGSDEGIEKHSQFESGADDYEKFISDMSDNPKARGVSAEDMNEMAAKAVKAYSARQQ